VRFDHLPLTLRQLQYACAVADELSFRRAAERCHVAQPSLSSQVAELERSLGIALFERDRRRVLVTAAGAEVLARARALLLAADDLVDAARRRADPLAGALRIGVIPTIGPYLLPDLDPALRRAFPALELRWSEDQTERLVAQVQGGDLDAALLALEADLGGLEHATIGADRFVLAAPAGHPLSRGRRRLKVEDLATERVLLLDDGHCLRDQALDLCALVGAQELGFRATSMTTLVQMAASGAGITLLPAMALEVENRRAELVIRRFREPAPHRTIAFAWRPGSPLREPIEALAAAAREAYVEIT
jgi:LysR family hydrogen peroxide-inducible transcriptional activator